MFLNFIDRRNGIAVPELAKLKAPRYAERDLSADDVIGANIHLFECFVGRRSVTRIHSAGCAETNNQLGTVNIVDEDIAAGHLRANQGCIIVHGVADLAAQE